MKQTAPTSTRKNIVQPAGWWDEFERQAAKERLSLSAWVGECCRAFCFKDLGERPATGRPLGTTKGDE